MATKAPLPEVDDASTYLADTYRGSIVVEYMHRWITTTDHKRIGIMYILSALLFLVIGGLEATMIRLQLMWPGLNIISANTYNALFTMHGTTMVFFVGMPVLFGFGNYLIPLMLGARDMAFPRLNAFSFWVSFMGGLLLYYSVLGGDGLYGMGTAPNVGWFAYAPLTSKVFSPGHSTDYWTLGVLLSGIGSIGTALNMVTTTLCLRCRGMRLMRMPLLVWLYLVTAMLVLVAVSPLTAAQIMLCLDRYLGAHFFDTQAGGSAVMWMHFFWIFGHPEVYILVLPAFGFANEIIPVFSRKVIFGYPAMVLATISIGFISLSVWSHHMFTVGLGPGPNAFFTLSTMIIAIPTGIKIFNWLGTMWGGQIRFATPMLFSAGFLFNFLLAGLTGVLLSVSPFDWQLGNSYFVVGHFHFVLVGAILMMIFAAFYYWFPKMSGRMLNERLGRWHFWLFLVGFHLTFDLMHFTGLMGMPRRIATYEADRHWAFLNLFTSIGVVFQIAGVAIFLWNLARSLHGGEKAGPDPWNAWTLEWSTTSPPPDYNFAEEPVTHSRRPLWDLKHPDDPDTDFEI